MRKLIVKLPDNRDYAGTLHLEDEHGSVLLGPFLVCGRADGTTAQHHGNPTCDPLLPFGNTPLGRYRLEGIEASGSGTDLSAQHFGAHGVLVLRPAAGDAALADANGRFYLFIQGGRAGGRGRLRPTNGSLRLSNRDQKRLVGILRNSRNVMCECRRMPHKAAQHPVAVNTPCNEGDPPRATSFLAWTNRQVLSRSIDDPNPDPPSHPASRFEQRFAPPPFHLFASGGGGGGGSSDGGYGMSADDLTARANELAAGQDYDKDPDGQTHCSEFVRDFVGKDLPELQGQAKDQVDQLSQSQDWNQLAYDKDPQLALRQAQLYANQGKTVIVAWKNPDENEPGNTGHIAVVVPSLPDANSHDGMFPSGQWGLRVPYIAQAGNTVSAKIAMSYGFGADKKSGLKIFVKNT